MDMYEILEKLKDIDSDSTRAAVEQLKALNKIEEGKKAKPDFLDVDKDGDKKEPMKKALKDKEEVDESVEEASTGDYSAKKARAGKDIGKPGKNFEKIAKKAGEKYGSKERGEKVAGAVLAKLRKENVEERFNGDVEEGNEFSGALAKAKATGAKEFEVDGKTYKVDEGWDDMVKAAKLRSQQPKVGDIERGHKHDIEYTSTGRRVTRRVDPNTGHSVGSDDETDAQPAKRGRGRPKGTGKSIGAKGPSGKSKLLAKEGADYGQAQQIYDELADLRAVAKQAQGGGQFPQGFASRLEAILYAAMTLIKNQQPGNAQVREDDLEEKAVSKKQQKFMGMVHAAQKGEKPASKEVAKVAKTMKKKDAEDFASTKHKGLPEKVKSKKKDESVEETTAGSVATAPSSGKASGIFGKGVYEGFNNRVEKLLTEGMSISTNQNSDTMGEEEKSITVTATGAEADALAALLMNAGLHSEEQHGEACESCGQMSCACEAVEEDYSNSPDEQTQDTDFMTNKIAGGLNKPKIQVNPNWQGDNPLAMRDLGKSARSLNLGEDATVKRLMDLYKQYKG